MAAYYSENDPFAAAWLRELINANLIAPGEVDERSVEDVKADDLKGFTQCHFFAGIGVWSYALRLAGWSDDRPVWSGSCPCPSFSAAGKGQGFEDPRHLWPCWFGLIRESRPSAIFGEQADKAIGFGWLDLVQTDLETQGYAVGATVLGAHSVGAPHRRQRLYFVADAQYQRGNGKTGGKDREGCSPQIKRKKEGRWLFQVGYNGATLSGSNSDGGNARAEGLQRSREHGLRTEDGRSDGIERDGERAQVVGDNNAIGNGRSTSGNDDREHERSISHPESIIIDSLDCSESRLERLAGNVREWRGPGWVDPITARSASEAGATRGFWADCDWWYGKDGKYRPIGAGLFPLVTGAPARVGQLRGYGNSIVPQVAQAFIEAYMNSK